MRVIGLLKMAQVMHTIINKESIAAINDTATLFSTNKYKFIFNKAADYDLYAYSVKLYQKVWTLKSFDLRKHPKYSNIDKDLISKGGFIFLHIISTLMFCDAEFIEFLSGSCCFQTQFQQ